MTKNHIHIVTITRNGEKHLFQLDLPKNTVRINHIQTSINTQLRASDIEKQAFSIDAGWLWLEIPSTQGLLPYYEGVKVDLPLYNQGIMEVNPIHDFSSGAFWFHGKKKMGFDLMVCPTSQSINGYYVDQIGMGEGNSYEVKIYLNLDINETI